MITTKITSEGRSGTSEFRRQQYKHTRRASK